MLEEVVDDARALSRLPLNARQRDHVESHLVLALADLGEDDEAALVLDTASGFAAHDQTSRATILWAKAEADFSAGGMGVRSRRYSMLIEDGVVKKINIEEKPGTVEVSGGDTLLGQL